MPLTGLDVYKLLPKTNCRECGPPTCLAFAMQVASGKVSAGACPYLSNDARDRLFAASEPPIRTVVAGSGEYRVYMGGESVLYRHEKKFVNAPPVFISLGRVDDGFSRRLSDVGSLVFERVGQRYRVEGFSVAVQSPVEGAKALEAGRDAALVPLIVVDTPSALSGLDELLETVRPIIGMATTATSDGFVDLCRRTQCPCLLKASNVSDASALTTRFASSGVRDLILTFDEPSPGREIASLVGIRRLSLKSGQRSLGYPTLARLGSTNAPPLLTAASLLSKYAAALVLPPLPREEALALLTWRHDLYSDPERPIQVQSRLYPVGQAGPDSPLYITTNFSLTFYSVENEVSASRIPSYILPVDTDGTSVLTAWAAGKFTVEKIALAMESTGANETSQRRLAVIPGHVSQLAAKLEQATGWRVIAGPQEASGIPAFSRSFPQRGV